MTTFPKSQQQAWEEKGVFRSGATDLWDRTRKGISTKEHIDLRDVEILRDSITISEDGIARIPAMMTITELAEQSIQIGHRALTQAASELATPAIRNVARVGGNLMQEVRCPYFRSGTVSCLKTGGDDCPAREGEHRYLSVVDLGGCIAPHPSTLALVFAALSASVVCIEDGEEKRIPVEDLWVRPSRRLILAVEVPLANERCHSSWYRISNRRFAEWPLVEVVLYVNEGEEGISDVYAYAGGIAAQPFPIGSLAKDWRGQSIRSISIDAQQRFLGKMKKLELSLYKEKLLTIALKEALAEIKEDV